MSWEDVVCLQLSMDDVNEQIWIKCVQYDVEVVFLYRSSHVCVCGWSSFYTDSLVGAGHQFLISFFREEVFFSDHVRYMVSYATLLRFYNYLTDMLNNVVLWRKYIMI